MKVINTEKSIIKSWADEIEEEAQRQLKNIANLPFIHSHIACMPDVHYGKGATIGSVIATKKAIIPAAVGVDIGCGMIAQKTSLKANELPDNLHQLRLDIEAVVPVGLASHNIIPMFVGTRKSVLNELNSLPIPKNLIDRKQSPELQMGTLGGGNHFIEICLDENQNVWIMLHSGSRGIGNRIGAHFIELAKKDMEKYFINLPDKDLAYLPEGSQHFNDYLLCVEWAQLYAFSNRVAMLENIVSVLLKKFPSMRLHNDMAINCHHNYVTMENHFDSNVYVTRKGAVRARIGDLGIIPGSMGTKSYIVEGLGNPDSFNSCSHGAGRRMSRVQAKKQFTLEDHIKATEGVECKKNESVIDETPGAYKDIDLVMQQQQDLVKIKHTLKQVLCIKG